MEEIKNLFIKGRMNQDVDDRIVPGGEYREARNVIITNSEGSDAGAVQRMKGFAEVADFGSDFTPIHMMADTTRDLLYVWLAPAFQNEVSKIIAVTTNGSFVSLVEGEFLNFQQQGTIVQANVLENYLFWTDNVNQPRVIDIEKALTAADNNVLYYTEEHHISVAKYNPYKVARAIRLFTYTVEVVGGDTVRLSGIDSSVKVGDFLVNITPQKNKIVGIITTINGTIIRLDRAIDSDTLDVGEEVSIMSSTMTDQSGDQSWKGDPDLLEDKFVRFSYRYKYYDDTYSLIAPYTQVMYIPKQGGYFLEGDEERAYKSTVVKFMENAINNIDLFIPLPSNQPEADYHIKEIEIIYTQSDAINAQVVDSIEVGAATLEIMDTPGLDGAHFKYTYKSKLPYKTVTQQDYIRVSDQIPIKAKAQSIAGNRVMYANYTTRLDAPETINFGLTTDFKLAQNMLAAEYPNHTLKQNRQYQGGIVLKDKFGRSSGVITSGFLNDIRNDRPSSTFHPYKVDTNESIIKWLGDALRAVIYDKIESDNLYATEAGVITINSSTTINFSSDNQIQLQGSGWQVGEYLRGEYLDYVKITSIQNNDIDGNVFVCDGAVSTEYYKYNPGLKEDQAVYSYTINPVGWYSFNFVVKQTEHEYYNAYLPGILKGSLKFDSEATTTDFFTNIDTDKVGTIVLYSDNINKIPRDLSEVGPDQEQYRSSGVRLYGRVHNFDGTKQLYPGRSDNEVSRIGTFKELFLNKEIDKTAVDLTKFDDLEGLDSNPLIGIIENNNNYGQVLIDPNTSAKVYDTDLAIFETEPAQTRLDIYWETSTSGLISDLNSLVGNSSDGPASVGGIFTEYNEATDFASNAPVSLDGTKVFNGQGSEINNYTVTIDSVKNKSNVILSSHPFYIVIDTSDPVAHKFKIHSSDNYQYNKTSNLLDSYILTLTIANNEGSITREVEINAVNSGVGNSTHNGNIIISNSGNHSESIVVDIDNYTDPEMFEVILNNGSADTIKYEQTALTLSNVEYKEENLYHFPWVNNDTALTLDPPDGYSKQTFEVISGEVPAINAYLILRNDTGAITDDPGDGSGTGSNYSKKYEVTLSTTGLNQTTEDVTMRYSVVTEGNVKYFGVVIVPAGSELNETVTVWSTEPTQYTLYDIYYLDTKIDLGSSDQNLKYELTVHNQLYIAGRPDNTTPDNDTWEWEIDPEFVWTLRSELLGSHTSFSPRSNPGDNSWEIVEEITGNDKKTYVKFTDTGDTKPRPGQTWYFDWTVSDCDGTSVGDSESGTYEVELT